MKCSNCGNTLLVGLVPKGIGRLIPLSNYRCLRCGKRNWRFTDLYSSLGAKMLLLGLFLGLLLGAYYLGGLNKERECTNSIRLAVSDSVEKVIVTHDKAPAPKTSPSDQDPIPELRPAPNFAAEPGPESSPAATEEEAAPPVLSQNATEQASSVDAANASGPDAMVAMTPAAPAQPKTKTPPAAPKVAPRASSLPDPVALLPPGEQPLEEVMVKPTKRIASRPREVAPKSRRSARSDKWALKIKGVSIKTKGSSVVVILTANVTLDKPKAFLLNSPERYVIDLGGTWAETKVDRAKGAGFVKGARLGVHHDKLRMVLDLKRRPKSAPTLKLADNKLIITLR